MPGNASKDASTKSSSSNQSFFSSRPSIQRQKTQSAPVSSTVILGPPFLRRTLSPILNMPQWYRGAGFRSALKPTNFRFRHFPQNAVLCHARYDTVIGQSPTDDLTHRRDRADGSKILDQAPAQFLTLGSTRTTGALYLKDRLGELPLIRTCFLPHFRSPATLLASEVKHSDALTRSVRGKNSTWPPRSTCDPATNGHSESSC